MNKNRKNKLLLCTFVPNHKVDKKINEIKEKFEVLGDVFVLGLESRDDESILTYNVSANYEDYKDKIKHTINLHRRQETNTLYTINALNTIIKDEIGQIDETYEINWENYRNSLVIISNDELEIIPTILKKRI